MTVEKVSLSLDPALLAEARELTGRGGLSALVNEWLELRLQQVRVTRLLDEMDEEFGPVRQHTSSRRWHSSGAIAASGRPDDPRLLRNHRLVPR